MRRRIASACLAGSLLCGGPAAANIYENFGAGARAQAMAGAVGAVVDDFTAAFHNPAGLALGPSSVGFGMHGSYDRTSILLMARPAGYDPPGYDDRLAPRSDTDGGGFSGGLDIGFSLRPFDGDFALGAVVRVPFEGLANIDTGFPDEREQYFSNQLKFDLLGGRLRSEMISLALAYRWQEWLSMGVGLVVLPAVETINDIYTPNAADPSIVEANFGIEQGLEQGVVAGLIARPVDWLRIGLSFQDEVFLAVDARNRVLLGGNEGDPVLQNLQVAQHYTPLRLAGSVALSGESWLVTMEGTWLAWSRYLDEHAVQPAQQFEDTLNWRLGLELPMGEVAFARFGLGWLPTPVPPQTGRTNYVDTDRFVLALGGGRTFSLWEQEFVVDGSIQVHALRATETHKATPPGGFADCGPDVTGVCDETPDRAEDSPGLPAAATTGLQTGNPGFPGFTAGGYVVVAGVDVKWRF